MVLEQITKNGFAYNLRFVAAGLLDMSLRFEGQHPPMHPNAEFQALDIIVNELCKHRDNYRKAFAPYDVQQK